MIIFNLKTYTETTGKNAENIIQLFESLINSGEVQAEKFMIAPSMLDMTALRKQYRLVNLISQNVNNKQPDKNTGWITPENLLDHEINFSLYNHSEHRSISDTFVEDIKSIQSRGINLIVCVENLAETRLALEAGAFGIAYEPKEFIGKISVTTQPEVVQEFIELVGDKAQAFIGAGVSTAEHVQKCKELGADGILLSSAFVKAEDKRAKALELLKV